MLVETLMTRPHFCLRKIGTTARVMEKAPPHVDGKEASPQIIGHILDLQMLVVVIVSHGIHAECGVVDENMHRSEPLDDGCDLATAVLRV
jgi:hypothetical protein